MYSDRLSFPSIPSEPPQPARRSNPAAAESAFAALYSEAMVEANRELSQIVSADSSDSSTTDATADPLALFQSCAAASGLPAGGAFALAGGDFFGMHDDLMQQVDAIRQGQVAAAHDIEAKNPATSVGDAMKNPASSAVQQTEGAFSSGIHRLISWLDSHAHLHSTHLCAASVRQAMEAAGIPTVDRPPSGDAGDYGPFLLRHGAQVIAQESYAPKAGDIAVFDRTEDHPAGHIQVFDGHQWVSDFVQHTFSPYRDQGSTPPATVYRLS